MGSLASKNRHTTIHVTQIQETHLEVKGKRLSPKSKPSATAVVNSERYVSSMATYHHKATEITASDQRILGDSPEYEGKYELFRLSKTSV